MPMTVAVHNRKPGLRVLLISLLLGAGLAGVLLLAYGPAARYLAQYWQRQLDTARDEEIPLRLQQIASLGNAGLPCLVVGLGASREAIARAAKQTLWDELERWKSLDRSEYQPKLQLLAQTLAAQVSGFGPTARCDAAELAVRILREFPAVARGNILTACETVLRQTASDRRLLADREPGERLGHAPASATTDSPLILAATPAWTRPADPLGPLAVSAGGNLPVELSPGPGDTKGYALVREGVGSSTTTAVAHPESLPAVAQAAPLVPPAAEASHPIAAAAWPRPESRPAKAEANKPVALPNRLAELDTVSLMRQLQVGNVREVQTELRQRGFNDVQLELARQLFDSDPQVRRELAQRLPSLQSIDAVPWLLQLCHDEDVEVRSLAVSLIATTGDPKLRAEAERLARLDADPRLKETAERIAKREQKPLR